MPAKSGIYLSRFDIRNIGLSLGVDITVRERKRDVKRLILLLKTTQQNERIFRPFDTVCKLKN